MKSKTEYKLVEWSFQDKIPLKKIILKQVIKQVLFFLRINGNKAGFVWVNAPSVKHLLTGKWIEKVTSGLKGNN